jgi:hypothetical protein
MHHNVTLKPLDSRHIAHSPCSIKWALTFQCPQQLHATDRLTSPHACTDKTSTCVRMRRHIAHRGAKRTLQEAPYLPLAVHPAVPMLQAPCQQGNLTLKVSLTTRKLPVPSKQRAHPYMRCCDHIYSARQRSAQCCTHRCAHVHGAPQRAQATAKQGPDTG